MTPPEYDYQQDKTARELTILERLESLEANVHEHEKTIGALEARVESLLRKIGVTL